MPTQSDGLDQPSVQMERQWNKYNLYIIINSPFVDCTEISKQKKKRRKYKKKESKPFVHLQKFFFMQLTTPSILGLCNESHVSYSCNTK